MKTCINLLSVKLLSALFLIGIFISCDDETEEIPETTESGIQLASNSTLGSILTDANGVTLYFFSNDLSGESTCLSGCLDAWPIFYAENPEIGTGLASSDFGTITHPSGSMQTTYKGWPLYYYSSAADGVIEAPGATAGEGAGDVWFVAKPDYTIMIAKGQLVGNDGENYTSTFQVGEGSTSYFVDALGHTLYSFSNDLNGVNNFTNSDFSNDGSWPVFTESLGEVPSALDKSDFGSIDVFGRTQLTYKGWPLYYFGADAERGETKGVSVPAPGVWPIVNESIEEAPAPLATIQVSNHATLGNILTDSEGRTLYFFSKDPSGTSACSGGCLNSWPLFYTEDIIVDGISATDFENVDQGGTMITTYKGWPLYHYAPAGDGVAEDAGNAGGEGIGGVWYVMKPNYSLMIARSQLVGSDGKNYLGDYSEGTGETTYFTDSEGRTLYTFSNDSKDSNSFTASDFSNDGSWPIYYVSIDELPSGLVAADFGEIDVFGEKQLTFRGWPIYYFGGDANRGENKGVSVPAPGVWPIINNDVVAAE